MTKIHTLLGRRGVVVSNRTLNRYATTELDFGRRQSTVPVADCEPGGEVQVDFGRLGMLTDVGDGLRRVVHGLIFTAVCSRHMFVWPTYRQTLADVIAGFGGRLPARPGRRGHRRRAHRTDPDPKWRGTTDPSEPPDFPTRIGDALKAKGFNARRIAEIAGAATTANNLVQSSHRPTDSAHCRHYLSPHSRRSQL